MKNSLWKMLTKAITGAALIAASTLAAGQLVNQGFETGTFTGWSTGGFGSSLVISTAPSAFPFPGSDWWAGPPLDPSPPTNNHMAALSSGALIQVLGQANPATTAPLFLWMNFMTPESSTSDYVELQIQRGSSPTLLYSLSGGDTSVIAGHALRSSAWKNYLLPVGTTGVAVQLWNTNPASSPGYALVDITPIPEPETYTMLLAGLGLMGWIVRRRRQPLDPGNA